MNLHRSRIALFCLGLFLFCGVAQSAAISVGAFSYDTFIPATGGSPGVAAFNVSNLTGLFSLAPDFPVTSGLLFQSATLALTRGDSSVQTLALGDIQPGFLLDANGNPAVQVSTDQAFLSAEFTATLAPLPFTLFDGSRFIPTASFVDIKLAHSAGGVLSADIDQTIIAISASPVINSIPEPTTLVLVVSALLLPLYRRIDRATKPRKIV